ncbi:bacterial extracellular solute-binding s, 3 family protein [Paraburkholderia xenovorans LB400]|uniref:Amino acid ABC transporter substrate-binding protein, PAAT family n=1 Tax=Paraburkholderia xenovorans (strain LB400) TaxID=266265 RepID=Q13HZ4_PARXL|nr:ABC transporter substrate-binding protein [Paraburkholderia xenovorans]ABE36295.1 amino acid ABC transporter substrate-binding protein, PAAT family [Paraburkholderia xenovorans LB400]AIP34659.1 bacterial extracellular solute-binding s, 3 family protein [Paraburkholderia xenovorans LB400]
MKHSRNILSAVAGTLAALAMGIVGTALAATTFNLSPDQHDRVRTTPDAAAIKAVPPSFPFVGKDELVIGMTVGAPPLAAYATDEKTVVGFDPDLAQLVADGLGRKLKIVVLAWEDWPLALQSGRVDAILSNVTVTEERKEKFDFSTYRRDVLGFYVANSSPIKAIREPKDVAGLRVITDSGTNQEKILLEWNKENVARGLKSVQVQYYDDLAVRDVALRSGRADAILSVNSFLAYEAAQRGEVRAVGTISGGWPILADVAITTRKGSGFAAPLTLLLNDLIRSGKYTQVLDRWNLGSEAIDTAKTNPPGLPKS